MPSRGRNEGFSSCVCQKTSTHSSPPEIRYVPGRRDEVAGKNDVSTGTRGLMDHSIPSTVLMLYVVNTGTLYNDVIVVCLFGRTVHFVKTCNPRSI